MFSTTARLPRAALGGFCASGTFVCAAPGGHWNDGAHDATATDTVSGDVPPTSASSNVENFEVDTSPPPAPTINNVPTYINANGTNPPAIGGSGEPATASLPKSATHRAVRRRFLARAPKSLAAV